MIQKTLRLVVCTCLCCLVFAGNSFSKEAPAEENWQFNLAPFYLWAINIDGDLTAGSISAPVDVPFSDVFDNLEAAFIVHFESVYKGKWGLLVDIDYLDIANDFAPIAGISQNVNLKLTVAEVDGFYRIQHDTHMFDFVIGLRYIEMDNKLTVIGGPTLMDDSQNWLDPLLGGRWIWHFVDNWSLIVRADIGGFGVGSDFTWQAIGLIDWQPFEHVSFLAGYRVLDMDYENGNEQESFHFDASAHGPIIGLNFRW